MRFRLPRSRASRPVSSGFAGAVILIGLGGIAAGLLLGGRAGVVYFGTLLLLPFIFVVYLVGWAIFNAGRIAAERRRKEGSDR